MTQSGKNHWIVLFEDTPAMQKVRDERFPSHLQYLKSHPEIFVDGSGLAADEGAPKEGGLWIVSATSRDEVLEFVLGDPMFCPEHRRFEIFATGKRLKIDAPANQSDHPKT